MYTADLDALSLTTSPPQGLYGLSRSLNSLGKAVIPHTEKDYLD